MSALNRDLTIHRLRLAEVTLHRAIRLEGLEKDAEAFGSTFEHEANQPDAWFAERLERRAVFGAFAGGQLLGVAGFYPMDGPKDRHKGVLFGMYVRPAGRRRGVGAALTQAILDHAAGQVEQVQTSVVAANAPARRLYGRIGFVEWGVERQALKHKGVYSDEVRMVKFLNVD